ncbi:MAG: ABC transporter substrate-binding protein [Janthinobacterium lividum]
MSTRRTVLTGLSGGLIASSLLARPARADPVVLRAGDQKGGAQALMKAAGALGGLPYRLEWSQFSAAAPLLEALNADAIDFGFAGDAPTTFALAAGVPARIVAPTRSSGASTAIMVPEASPIRSVAELRGRVIATNRGSIGHSLVLAVAEAQGWAASDIKLANLLPSEAKAALATKAVDAWCSWGVYVAQARLADGARIVVDGSGGLLTGLSYMVARDGAIARKRAALLDFTARLAGARRWAATHRDAYAAVLANEIGVAPAVARLIFERETPLPVPIDALVIRDQQKTADRYLAAGVIRTRLEAGALFDASFNAAVGGAPGG